MRVTSTKANGKRYAQIEHGNGETLNTYASFNPANNELVSVSLGFRAEIANTERAFALHLSAQEARHLREVLDRYLERKQG